MIDKFLFWLYLRTPERLKKLYPQRIIDRIGEATKKEIDMLQSDIIRQKWQLTAAQQKIKEVKPNVSDNNS